MLKLQVSYIPKEILYCHPLERYNLDINCAHTIKIIAHQQFVTSSQHKGPTEQIAGGHNCAAQKLRSDRVARRPFYSTDQHPPQDPL